MASNPLAFAVDLNSVRDRLATLSYFLSVQNIQDATNALEHLDALPPAAFVSTARETAEKNKVIGGHSQRVSTTISVLFCVPAERAADDAADVVEETRKAVIRILLGWTPAGAGDPLNYERYLLRATGDGLIWGEVLMTTSYRLTLA